MIDFIVEDRNGFQTPISIPEGVNVNLMEVLKALEYDVLAACGGMALCAGCMVQVLEGAGRLPPPTEGELDMLDTMPSGDDKSRLSCQITINEALQGCVFKITG